MDKTQFSFKHSWRHRRLKALMIPLSVGFPCRMESNSIRLKYAHWSSLFDMNSGSLSTCEIIPLILLISLYRRNLVSKIITILPGGSVPLLHFSPIPVNDEKELVSKYCMCNKPLLCCLGSIYAVKLERYFKDVILIRLVFRCQSPRLLLKSK